MSYSFLRAILKIAGWVPEDIEQVMKELETDPDKYAEILKQIEDAHDKVEERSLR